MIYRVKECDCLSGVIDYCNVISAAIKRSFNQANFMTVAKCELLMVNKVDLCFSAIIAFDKEVNALSVGRVMCTGVATCPNMRFSLFVVP